jgi:hypothetical protein
MMLPDAECMQPDFVGEYRFLNHVAQHVRGRMQRPIGAGRDVAEGVEPNCDVVCHVIGDVHGDDGDFTQYILRRQQSCLTIDGIGVLSWRLPATGSKGAGS